jgi:hypothetical protein
MASPPVQTPTAPRPAGPALAARTGWRGWWLLFAVTAALVPVAGVFSSDRIFQVRDLSMSFWGRYLWLRRSLFAGEWPLWDAYLGGGQSAVADALNQMFLLPVVALRLVGSEVVGFNLWVAAPFPLAALGGYLFLRRRFSPPASALGAIAFAACGPIVSTGNFPNLSWSVAAMPWVMWAADRVAVACRLRDVALLGLVVAFQALSGEPVSLVATAAVAGLHTLLVGSDDIADSLVRRVRAALGVGVGLALGFAGAAIQLLPLAEAVRGSWRPVAVGNDSWALHPLALAETVARHVFGDYFGASNLTTLPWMPPLNSGRDPFFFSLYFGAALLALALMGALAGRRRAWSLFWVFTGLVALFAAFGSHTPFNPFLRAHVPLMASFRFPVKYLVVMALAISALSAAGWDALRDDERRTHVPRRYRAARICAVACPVLVAVAAYALSGACLYAPLSIGQAFVRLAASVGVYDRVEGATFLLTSLPETASRVMLLALAGGFLLAVASSRRTEARTARATLYALVVVDLLVAAWGVNPTLDVMHYRQPDWVGATRGDPQARFYMAGKFDGTIRSGEPDGPTQFHQPAGLSALDGRGALSAQLAFMPAAWQVREMLSYDLAVLWPRPFEVAVSRFRQSDLAGRDLFLRRTGVRYRIVRAALGGDRPSVPMKYLNELRLFDWGPVAPRVSIVPKALVVPDTNRQVDLLFDPSFDTARLVALAAPPGPAWGRPGAPAPASARVVSERANELTVEAAVPADGGFLLVLDSYSDGWSVSVDGAPARQTLADALFRAIPLSPGRHRVVFRYRPRSFLLGGGVTAGAFAVLGLLAVIGRRREPARPEA